MTPPGTSSQLAADVDKKFGELVRLSQRAYDKDKEYIEAHHSFWDEVGNAIKNFFTGKSFMIPVIGVGGNVILTAFSAKQASDAAKQFITDTKKQMDDALSDAKAYWDLELRDSAHSSGLLEEKARAWKDQQTTTIAPMIEELERLEKQDHWSGAGHDAYKKAIPSQRGALDQMQSMVEASAQLYEKGGLGLKGAYTSVDTGVTRVRGVVAAVLNHSGTDTERWGYRMLTARSQYVQLLADLQDCHKKLDRFGDTVAQHQTKLTTRTETSTPFAKDQGKWPEARGDTTNMAPKDQ